MTAEQLLEISVEEMEKLDDLQLLELLGPLLRHTRPTDETRRKKIATEKVIDLETGEIEPPQQPTITKEKKPKKQSKADKMNESILNAIKMLKESGVDTANYAENLPKELKL